MDARLAAHLLSMYSVSGMKNKAQPPIDAELFRRYVSFAKKWVHPQLTDESAKALMKGYTDLRNQGTSREMITATPRILESLIRISESVAKMELREEVINADVEEAIRLLKAATYAAAVDPETGLIDMVQLIVGEAGDRQLGQEQVKVALNEKLGERKEQLASDAELRSVLTSLEQQGAIRRQGKMIEGRAS